MRLIDTKHESVRSRAVIAVTIIVSVLGATSPGRAQLVPELQVVGDEGVPGGTAPALLLLANDVDSVAVSAAVNIDFPADLLAVELDDCAIAPRIEASHVLQGGLTDPGRLTLEVLARLPVPPLPLGDGDLADCVFDILPGVPAGTANLHLTDPSLVDAAGMRIEVIPVDGAIRIVLAPTPTVTPSATLTATPTGTPVAIFDRVNDCSVAPPGQRRPLGPLALLLPAFLLWARWRASSPSRNRTRAANGSFAPALCCRILNKINRFVD